MKHSKTLVLAIVAALAAGGAIAAPATAPVAKHGKLDTNGDGAISRAEAAANPRLAARFDRLDVNRDGRIDASERPHRGGRGAGMGLDANQDGVIDRAEAARAPGLAQEFDRLDRNRDGRLDASERPKRGGHGGRGGIAGLDANGDGAIDRAEAAKAPRFAQKFDRLDKNRDGRIDAGERPQRSAGRGHGGIWKADADTDGRLSRAEAANTRLAPRFDQFDANRDGFVDKAEARAAWQRLRGERKRADGVGPGATAG